MSNRLKGTLAGIAASAAGVALWIGLIYAGFIAGIAGALIGILFILVYTKINKDDKSKYPYIFGSALIAVEIVFAELLAIAILASLNGVPFGAALEIPEIKKALLIDVLIGVLLGYAVFVGYLFSLKRKNQMQNVRKSGIPPAYQNPYETNNASVDPSSAFYNPNAQNSAQTDSTQRNNNIIKNDQKNDDCDVIIKL